MYKLELDKRYTDRDKHLKAVQRLFWLLPDKPKRLFFRSRGVCVYFRGQWNSKLTNVMWRRDIDRFQVMILDNKRPTCVFLPSEQKFIDILVKHDIGSYMIPEYLGGEGGENTGISYCPYEQETDLNYIPCYKGNAIYQDLVDYFGDGFSPGYIDLGLELIKSGRVIYKTDREIVEYLRGEDQWVSRGTMKYLWEVLTIEYLKNNDIRNIISIGGRDKFLGSLLAMKAEVLDEDIRDSLKGLTGSYYKLQIGSFYKLQTGGIGANYLYRNSPTYKSRIFSLTLDCIVKTVNVLCEIYHVELCDEAKRLLNYRANLEFIT